MAFDLPSPADAAALSARREQVRAWAGRIAQAVEAMPLPEGYRDGERAARAITVADRMLAKLPETLPDPEADPETVTPARQRLRIFADEVFAVVEDLPMPKTFMDGERAGRCVLAIDQLFHQLYAPRKPRKIAWPEPGADLDDTSGPEDKPEIAVDILLDNIDRLALAHARETGFYPDGSACDPAAPPEPQRIACPGEDAILAEWMTHLGGQPCQPGENILPLARIMAARANGSVRAAAHHSGQWPDGRAFRDDDPDFYVLSQAFTAEMLKQPGPKLDDVHEAPGPSLFPWWLVKNPDTG